MRMLFEKCFVYNIWRLYSSQQKTDRHGSHRSETWQARRKH
jgi:hypothetical protein